MSSTSRGAVRNEADFYITPDETINSLLNNFKLAPGAIWEPFAGNGAIIKVLRSRKVKDNIVATEIRDEKINLMNAHANVINCHTDFLTYDYTANKVCWNPVTIITNPPFGIAQEAVERCFEIAPDADIIMLLRLNFLGSQKRKEFWERHPVKQIYILSERPSFGKHCTCMFGHKIFYGLNETRPDNCPTCGEKWKSITTTDSCEYAWFIWSEWREPLVKVI